MIYIIILSTIILSMIRYSIRISHQEYGLVSRARTITNKHALTIYKRTFSMICMVREVERNGSRNRKGIFTHSYVLFER